jgi:hypothetical protein
MSNGGGQKAGTPGVAAPVGGGDYEVQPGDCVSSVACDHGHLWETILNDPANAELKRSRTNHNVLLPGDRLTIPPIRVRSESRDTDQRHRFRRKGVPEVFRIRFLDEDDKPRANLPYTLDLDGVIHSGATNADGELKHAIPPNARQGKLVIGTGRDSEQISLWLGHLDPIESISGAQARLNNLGIDCGKVDGILGPRTRKAIERFQRQRQLPPTGELDQATLAALGDLHGA